MLVSILSIILILLIFLFIYMSEGLVRYVLLSLITTTLYIYIIYSNYQKQKKSKLFLFYIISSIVLYFTIINVIMLLYFYDNIIKKKGPQGEKGYIGEKGLSGEKGSCDIKCFDKKCSNDFMDAIEYKLNELLSKDNKTKNDPRVIKMREHNILKMGKDDYDKYKKEHYNEQTERTKSYLAVRIIEDIKNIEYNEKAEKIYEELEIKKENKKTTTNPDQKLKLEMDIDKLQFDYESYRDLSITDKKLKNNVLNQIVFAICNSKQYNQAINDNLGEKNKADVNNYVIRVLHELVEFIYNSSGDTFESKIEFFNSEHMKFKDEVLLELMKYDVYHWGLQRIFRPLHIKIDDSIKYNNYLPEDNKPPLKILYTNYYIPIMDNQHYDDKNPKSQDSLLTFYRTRNHYIYRQENYYPVGNIFETKKGSYTNEIKLEDYMNIFELTKEIDNLKEKFQEASTKEDKKRIDTEIKILEEKYIKINPTLSKKINDLVNKDKTEIKLPTKQTIIVTGDVDSPKELTFLQSNESNQNEREDISIYRPVCNTGYESIADYTLKGYKKKLSRTEINNSIKCLPKVCLEDIPKNELDIMNTSIGKLYYKKDKEKINKENKFESSHHLFRHVEKEEDYKKNPLRRIKKSCLINSRSNPIKQAQDNIGIGWNGRPIRNPKYSIFSYLIEMPQAIISAKTSNYKYYIIHTDEYNKKDLDDPNNKDFRTSSKNLYYVLALNHKNNKYDRCLVVSNKGTIIRDEIKENDIFQYWQIIPEDNKFDEIRLRSFKEQDKYLTHYRNRKHYRREIVKKPVYEELKSLQKDNDNQIFVNIKSKYGTHIETALDKQSHPTKTLKTEKDGTEYYEKKLKQNKSKEYDFYERKIKHS